MTDRTHVTLVCDRSGSMATIRDDAQGGVRTFIKALKAANTTLTLVQFDDQYELLWQGEMVGLPDYELIPRGSTALLDAVGRAMAETGEYLAKIPEDQRPGKVVFCVQTDGQENASHDWTIEKIRAKVDEQTSTYKWEFVFLGAGLAAFQGQAMGFKNVTSNSPTGRGTAAVYNVAAAAVMSYASNSSDTATLSMPKTVDEEDDK